jgi:hypothetical protein
VNYSVNNIHTSSRYALNFISGTGGVSRSRRKVGFLKLDIRIPFQDPREVHHRVSKSLPRVSISLMAFSETGGI